MNRKELTLISLTILITLFITLFLVSCDSLNLNFMKDSSNNSPEKNQTLDSESTRENTTLEDNSINPNINAKTASPSTDCTVGWSCIDFRHRANRLENCTVTKVETCPVVCDNGRCLSRARSNITCTPGFKCKGEFLKGYQMEGCDWTSETKCEYGCANNTCQPKPNITESTTSTTGSSTSQPAEPVIPTYTISQGQSVSIDVQGTEAILRVYNLEDGRVRLMLDNFKTDWLSEGQSNTFPQGLKINVKEIYFQSYQGGKREVRYSLG
ncbi:hypothetical protein HYU21_01295 [Candidatus Woesearchaeota archaeon]|nr:hypothetical protein [Candidatus Woesearchaeota archaeon]